MAKELGFKQGAYKEAVDYFKKKINIPTKRWNSLKGAMHTRAFTVAGAMRADILLDFRNAVDRAIEKGDSLQDFRNNFYKIASKWRAADPSFDKKMEKPKYGAWRSKVIYQTNMLTAAAAAQERQARAMPDVFTHAKYVCMMLPGSREEHKHWNGTVLPVNDPWWEKHSPPNGFGCLCEKEFISKYEMDRGDEKVTRAPTAANDTRNIGENWDYSIGDADAENQRLKEYTKEKEEKLFRNYPEARKTAKEERSFKYYGNNATESSNEKNENILRKELKKTRESEETSGKNVFSEFIDTLKKRNINKLEVKNLSEKLSEQDIIKRLCGIDKTNGACVSLALAYIGNKSGFDVLDFRGGESGFFFREPTTTKKIARMGAFSEVDTNGFKVAKRLLKRVEEGKEYLFSSGEHVAIVRKSGRNIEFLELQCDEPQEIGFQKLTKKKLEERFGTIKTIKALGKKLPQEEILIDVKKISEDPNFRDLLGYINTKSDEQRKNRL